jgi:hypothetical protein
MVPSGHGISTTSALGTSTRCGQRCCSASTAIPNVSESTHASTRPPGRSTRVISVTRSSAASRSESVRSSAITPSAQPSARNSRPFPSAVTVTSRPAEPAEPSGQASAGGGAASGSMTRSTLWPAQAATSAAFEPGPEMSMRNCGVVGSQLVSWARATAA